MARATTAVCRKMARQKESLSSQQTKPSGTESQPLSHSPMPLMPQTVSQAASPTSSTSAASSSTPAAAKVSFSFSGGSTSSKKPQLAAVSALTHRLKDASGQSGAAGTFPSVSVSDGVASFQSLSALASASASPSTTPLVIPLKQSTPWRERALAASTATSIPAASFALSSTGNDSKAPDAATLPATLQEQAEQQLLAAATPNNNTTTTNLPAELYTTRSIPLPTTHPTPHPTSHSLHPAPLPTATTASTAAAAVGEEPRWSVPLEEYGVALLRGMGWKGPGDVVGGANKADVQPVLIKRREERLGLGADTAAVTGSKVLPHQQAANGTDGAKATAAETKDTSTAGSQRQSAAAALRAKVGSRVLALASQQLRMGVLVYVAAGRHKRQYGRVTEMTQRVKRKRGGKDDREEHEEEVRHRLEVKLNSGERVSVDSEDVDVLDERALPDDHPAFGTVKKQEEERRESEKQHDKREDSGRHHSRKSEYDDRPDKRHKSSHPHTPSDHSAPSSSRSSAAPRPSSPARSSSSGRPVWCAPGLRIRIVSRSLASGSCFRCKARVVDVPAASSIQLLMNDGRTVTASEQQLETVIPSEKGGAVQVVRGELKGHVGELIERDSKRSVAIVQLEDDLQLHTLDFDDICERVVR